MRVLASVYLVISLCALGLVLLMQVPGALIVFYAITLGLGWVVALVVLNTALWLIAYAPAALGAWFNWRIGLGLAAVITALLATFPRWLPEPGHQGRALLAPPLAATAPVQVRSVQINTLDRVRDMQNPGDPVIAALLRNPDLDWVRLGSATSGQVFARKNGILHEVQNDRRAYMDPAEIEITIARQRGRRSAVWRNAGLSPWQARDTHGYLIHDARTDTPLARNLSLTLLRAVKPVQLEITGVEMDVSSDPRIEFVRVPYGTVQQDPDQTLETDLRALGLWADPSDSPDQTDDLNAALRAMLQDVKLAQYKGGGSRWPNDYERQVLGQFNAQIAARVLIPERADLIAAVDWSKIRGVRRGGILDAAQETPVLMARMVDNFYDTLTENGRIYELLDRIEQDWRAPLAHAIGQDEARFHAAFAAVDRQHREFLIANLHRFDLTDPYGLLATVFAPFPGPEALPDRFSPAYRADWITEPWVEDFVADLQYGDIPNKDDDQRLADQVILALLKDPDTPDAVLRDFTARWVLSRRVPIGHDREVVAEVLAHYAATGPARFHADLATYFQDVVIDFPDNLRRN